VLHKFVGGNDGSVPLRGIIRDAYGNLYGTTTGGGANGNGTIFKVSQTGKLSVLHAFAADEGTYPFGELIQDAYGNLYGTTNGGGTLGYGTVFRLSKTGKLSVLHTFSGRSDGANPVAGVVVDAKGTLYGSTSSGGANHHGTVYKLTP
jgi:uncharacterized repeat protein (TIGR03803 family)